MTPDEFRRLGHDAVDLIADYLGGLPDGPVFRPVPPAAAEAFATTAVPTAGTPAPAVLADFAATVAPYPFGNGHPRFFGWVNSPPHPLGVLAEALAAAMNPSVAGGNHAAVHVEHQVVRWFRELAGFPTDATGLLVSGGSAATLTALAVARHVAAARAGVDIRRTGLTVAGRAFVAYVGDQTHAAARKSLELLGIGSDQIRTIGSDGERRIQVDELRRWLAEDVAAGRIPVAVVASVGTVNTGAIDPVDAIADVCAERGVWLHLDGAYGGPAALLLDEYADVRPGIGRADSIALDPHKWLYTPVDAGLVLLRDARAARDCFSLVPPYLRADGDAGGVAGPVWFSEYGFDQTRPFRALKVWMLLRHLGLDGYRSRLAHDIAMAGRLAEAIEAQPDLELLGHGLSVVCFRCVPPGWDGDLDAHNQAVLTAVQLGGDAFLSGTTVDGYAALRACVVNYHTTPTDIDSLVATVRSASHRLIGPGSR